MLYCLWYWLRIFVVWFQMLTGIAVLYVAKLLSIVKFPDFQPDVFKRVSHNNYVLITNTMFVFPSNIVESLGYNTRKKIQSQLVCVKL